MKSKSTRKLLITILATTITTGLIYPATAAPGDLDTSFGTGGKVTTAFGATADKGRAVALQSDGKIVVVGYSTGVTDDFAVVRYNTDGSLDTSFGTGGKVVTDLSGQADIASAIAMQSDGKILVAGYSSVAGNLDFGVVRYNVDGSLDTSFDTDGIVTTAVGGAVDNAKAIKVQSDGKIVVVGYSNAGTNDFAVVRYNTDGSLDTSFDTDGKVTTPVNSASDVAYAMALQSDGKIVAVGETVILSRSYFAVVRYNVNGTLDNSFDGDGKISTALGTANAIPYSMTLQSDGKIVAVGYANNGTNLDFALVRYATDGSLDTSFGSSGIVIEAVGTGTDQAYATAIQSDGKILAAGYSLNAGTNDFSMIRFNANGLLDTSFGTGGKVFTGVGAGTDQANAMILQTDGKILVAGESIISGFADFSLVRYEITDSAAADAARIAAESARIAAESVAAKKAKEQKELTEILSLIPELGKLSLNIGETSKALTGTKCVKGKTIKYVFKGQKCPKGYVKKK